MQSKNTVYSFLATKQVYSNKTPAAVLLSSMLDLYIVFVEQTYISLSN